MPEEKFWTITAILYDLPTERRELFEADLKYFEKDMKLEIFETLQNLKNNRNFRFKLVSKIAGLTSFGKISIEQLTANLELLSKMNIIKTEYFNDDGRTIGKISFNELFFEIWKMIQNTNPLMIKIPTHKDMLEKIEKEIKKTYKCEYSIDAK